MTGLGENYKVFRNLSWKSCGKRGKRDRLTRVRKDRTPREAEGGREGGSG